MNVWLEPVVEISVTTTPDRVVLKVRGRGRGRLGARRMLGKGGGRAEPVGGLVAGAGAAGGSSSSVFYNRVIRQGRVG